MKVLDMSLANCSTSTASVDILNDNSAQRCHSIVPAFSATFCGVSVLLIIAFSTTEMLWPIVLLTILFVSYAMLGLGASRRWKLWYWPAMVVTLLSLVVMFFVSFTALAVAGLMTFQQVAAYHTGQQPDSEKTNDYLIMCVGTIVSFLSTHGIYRVFKLMSNDFLYVSKLAQEVPCKRLNCELAFNEALPQHKQQFPDYAVNYI